MDIKQAILDEVELKNVSALSQLITENLKNQRELNSMQLDKPVVEFRIQHFLRGLKPLVSEFKKTEAMDAITKIISTLLGQWEYDLSPQECFVLYHIRDLGKFRLKDDKLFAQLQTEWSVHKDYVIDKNELKQILKDFKNIKFIDYRKGTVVFNTTVVLR